MANSGRSGSILTDEKDGVLTITLNNPRKKNALDNPTYDAISAELGRAASDPGVSAVIVTGSGDYFCSGTDVKASLDPSMADPASASVGRFMLAVLAFPKLLVAAVNGPAVGIGVTLLPHCDLVYAATSATFWTPFLRIAVVPEFGSSVTFPRILGTAMAGDMLIRSRVLSSAEGLQRGLVSELIGGADILQDVRKKVEDILRLPLAADSLLLYKRMIRGWTAEEMERVVRAELKILGERYVKGETKHALEVTMARQRGIKAAAAGRPASRL